MTSWSFDGWGLAWDVAVPMHEGMLLELTQGRPLQYPLALVERCLWETAAAGGSATRAHAVLSEQGLDPLPPRRTIQNWTTGRFRNRYHEMLSEQARDLEEIVAAQATANAIRMGDAEQDALRQTMAGLSMASGVEASMILRNISQSKAVQVDKAQLLRGRPTQINAERSLDELARALERLGLVESTAEEITDAVEGTQALIE